MDPATPVYAFEVRYFRAVLGIGYESGCRLRVRGILTPDAYMTDGRALYLRAGAFKDQTFFWVGRASS